MADRKFRPEIEVLSAADAARRRHWSDADKLRMVEESFLGHCQVAATARRHGVSRSLLTTWRRQYRHGELVAGTSAAFIPLTLAPGAHASMPPLRAMARANHPDSRLEVVLRNDRRLLVPFTMDPEILARLLRVLDRS
ncbi:transposase [uncultured Jannaschia sp.]|uniref:IS66-like element accessory protein TnpA n=1 Tax=uncultured Jannaschia sp. TaxID=293347 RepID=UPI00260D7740|nr:transposase [uncultured Jannaschia sp.]